MKAWILSDARGNNPYCSLVWAETAGKAKSLANSPDGSMYQCDLEIEDWRDIRAVRWKNFDNCENMSEKDICVSLIENYCWHFVIGEQFYDEDNIEEFKELFD
nr:MAG TPA: hypothetical protein [Caudoviricetes sp.]